MPAQLKNIDLNLLVSLRTLLAHKNVSAAAKELGLTQPALSNSLSRLRHLLNDEILVRGPKSMILTDRALRLEQPICDALRMIEAALATPKPFDPQTSTRRFTMAVTDFAQLTLVPKIIAHLSRIAPLCQFGIRTIPTYTPVDELATGVFDACIVYRVEEHASLKKQLIAKDRFVCILRKGHPALKQKLTLKRFAELKHALVSPIVEHEDDEFDGIVDRALAEHKLKRQVAFSIPHFFMAPFVVSESDLVMTIAEGIAKSLDGACNVEVVEAPLKLPDFEANLIWHQRNDNDPAIVWLRKAIRDATVSHR